ncbi:hypothetical protein PHYBOEH_002538 [Phytophthora boehmeriae]|uniref:Carbonic anhydrase n=1 Tax=Phytophthora boehmeriae TaxID=109152 RepID=A0A8T1WSS7_9STRA|nr:hypothetical protein PHYBOEH_002538 [Phytophthora boehmeriae]
MAENSEGYKAAVNGGNCTVATKEKSYKLAQFHIHIPSEHTIGGKAFDGELHFVHLSDDNKTALVAGLFLQKSDVANTKSAIGNIVDAMDSVSASRSIPVILDSYAEIIESNVADSHVFNYPGSLTTPPCSEIVDWWVVRKPIAISTDEYNRIMSNLAQLEITNDGKNARWTQPLYQRTVKIYN